jgi:hypothetical protein
MSEEPLYTPPERSRFQLLWWDISTAATLWLIRHRLRRCPMCKGARMVHHFADEEGFAELRRCWTCTGDDRYLAATKIPAVQVVDGHGEEVHGPHLRRVK